MHGNILIIEEEEKSMAFPHEYLTLQTEGLILDKLRYLAIFSGQNINLTSVEFNLLRFLAASPGRIYNRQQIMDQIYHDERNVSDRTVDSHIKKIRKKIARVDPGVELIHSVYGVGYKFEIIKSIRNVNKLFFVDPVY